VRETGVPTGLSASMHHAASHHDDQQEPERTPTTPELPPCCLLLAGCSIALARAGETGVHVTPAANTTAVAVANAMPESRTFGPEPPPPKA
jgi:hypothetical protein